MIEKLPPKWIAPSPSVSTTRPLGNSEPRPGALEIGGLGKIGKAELAKFNPEIRKGVLDVAARSGRRA